MNSVIWDMDGVLLDSEPIYERVEQAVVSQYGKNIAPIIPLLLGRTAPACAQITVEKLQLPISPAEYLAQRNAQLLVHMTKVQLLPGVERTVRHLRHHAVRQAIATSSPRDLLVAKQHAHQPFFALFDALVCADDVPRGKPDPDIFLAAARAIGQPPANCVVFEDAPAGCRAARLAAMKCVALPNHRVDLKLYQDEDPILIVPSARLLDVDLSLLGLPPLPKLHHQL